MRVSTLIFHNVKFCEEIRILFLNYLYYSPVSRDLNPHWIKVHLLKKQLKVSSGCFWKIQLHLKLQLARYPAHLSKLIIVPSGTEDCKQKESDLISDCTYIQDDMSFQQWHTSLCWPSNQQVKIVSTLSVCKCYEKRQIHHSIGMLSCFLHKIRTELFLRTFCQYISQQACHTEQHQKLLLPFNNFSVTTNQLKHTAKDFANFYPLQQPTTLLDRTT